MTGGNRAAAHAGIEAEHEQIVARGLWHKAVVFTLRAVGESFAAKSRRTGGVFFIFHGGNLFPSGPIHRGAKKKPLRCDTGRAKDV